MYLCWRRLGLPEPTPLQLEITEYLAFGPDPSVPRNELPNSFVIGEAFRGLGKSWLYSALVLWELYNDPTYNVMVVSATAQRANDFSRFCHRLIHDIPELRHLRPSASQRDSAIAWDVGPAPAAHAPSCRSLGIGGQLVGARADLIVADDCEIVTNSATEEMRAKIRAAFAEFSSILKPGGRVGVLGTPQSEQTVYQELQARGYHVRAWPARVPEPEKAQAMGDVLAPSVWARVSAGEAGQPIEPRRFDAQLLEEKEAREGRSRFALQYQLDTSLSDALRFPLRLADLVVTDLGPEQGPQTVVRSSQPVQDLSVCGIGRDKPRQAARTDDWAPYDLVLCAVDPAGRGKDETVAAVVAGLAGNVYLLGMGAWRGEGYSDEVLEAIVRLAARNHADRFLVESNFGDGALSRLLLAKARGVHPIGVEEVRQHQQKEARIIEALEPVMNQHRLIVSRAVLEWDARPAVEGHFGEDVPRRLTYQLSRLTRERGCLAFDDRLDALAIGVRGLLDHLSLEGLEEVARRSEEARDEELRRFCELADGMEGRTPADHGWASGRR